VRIGFEIFYFTAPTFSEEKLEVLLQPLSVPVAIAVRKLTLAIFLIIISQWIVLITWKQHSFGQDRQVFTLTHKWLRPSRSNV
jgi:hypothetical protein